MCDAQSAGQWYDGPAKNKVSAFLYIYCVYFYLLLSEWICSVLVVSGYREGSRAEAEDSKSMQVDDKTD